MKKGTKSNNQWECVWASVYWKGGSISQWQCYGRNQWGMPNAMPLCESYFLPSDRQSLPRLLAPCFLKRRKESKVLLSQLVNDLRKDTVSWTLLPLSKSSSRTTRKKFDSTWFSIILFQCKLYIIIAIMRQILYYRSFCITHAYFYIT